MQERNPEVHVDVNRPDININEQILALKLITRKLESAHKGQNVEWPASTDNCKFAMSYFSERSEVEIVLFLKGFLFLTLKLLKENLMSCEVRK